MIMVWLLQIRLYFPQTKHAPSFIQELGVWASCKWFLFQKMNLLQKARKIDQRQAWPLQVANSALRWDVLIIQSSEG